MAKKPPARKKGKSSGSERWIIIGIVIAVIVIALTLWGPFRRHRAAEGDKAGTQRQAAKHEQAPPKEHALRQAKRETSKQGPALLGSPATEKTATVAVVIDDLGVDLKQAREIVALPGQVTLAVMPGLAQSKQIAELAKRSKREVLIHLPMEYRGRTGTPAPGMLRSNMTPLEFLNTVSDDVESVPGADGINNHEGSAITENKEAMKFLMAELKARNLMFLDSFTSPKSVGYATAREFGVKSAKRDVFLDNEGDNPSYIRQQLDELADLARKNGRAIGIGHPHPATISELKKWLTEAGQQGIEIVPVSKMMH